MTKKFFLILFLTTMSACGSDTSTTPITSVLRDPVLFVHGYARTSTDWSFMIARFKSAGWADAELHTLSYGIFQSNASIAGDIKLKVDSILSVTSATKVDIVAHSMGSLSTRYYIRNLGGDAKVDSWVSLGGPNHGTATANDCGLGPCLDMRPGSSFLLALNGGDETPGNVRYGTWWSPIDETILPNNSVLLAGATNNQTSAIGHLNLVSDLTVYNQVRAFIAP